MADLLDRIRRDGLCHGCGACTASVPLGRIEMALVDTGFNRPRVRGPALTADESKTVSEVCSGLSMRHSSSGPQYDPNWGTCLSIDTAHAVDPEVRFKGSSGGVVSAAAIYLLEQGLVEFVLQTAADPQNPVGNMTVISQDRADVLAAAGSRYAPSSPLADLERHLESGATFAFIGKPCDVAALRRMAKRDPRIDRQIPFALAFFCAGVPSRMGALEVVQKLDVHEQDLAAFTYRGRGWPGLVRATRRNGSEETMGYSESWGTILNRHLQFRCKICPDGTGEFADLVCADAWYGKDGFPDFADRDGRSLVIARTPQGRRLLDGMTTRGTVVAEPLPMAEIQSMQPYQFDRKRAVAGRLLAMIVGGRLVPRFKGFALLTLAIRSSPVWFIRNVVGTYRRLPTRMDT